jgi:hypothetical protein
MRRKGSKDGYFWTIVPSGTCANAVVRVYSLGLHVLLNVTSNLQLLFSQHMSIKSCKFDPKRQFK